MFRFIRRFALWRAKYYYTIGNFHQAINVVQTETHLLETIITNVSKPSLEDSRKLCALYCDLQKLHFVCGQMEEAIILVIRAHRHLGIDRLPTNPALDLKTAHVIKAGLAAAKLLEDGGLATLMIRQGEEPEVYQTKKVKKIMKSGNVLQFPVKDYS